MYWLNFVRIPSNSNISIMFFNDQMQFQWPGAALQCLHYWNTEDTTTLHIDFQNSSQVSWHLACYLLHTSTDISVMDNGPYI